MWLVATFVPAGPVVIGLDDTIERCWGAKLAGQGIYRDLVHSSHGIRQGQRAALGVGDAAGAGAMGTAGVGLPFLILLMPSQRWADKQDVRQKSLVDGAQKMLLQAAR